MTRDQSASANDVAKQIDGNLSFVIFGSVCNADFLSGFTLPRDNISAPVRRPRPRQSSMQCLAPCRLLPPAGRDGSGQGGPGDSLWGLVPTVALSAEGQFAVTVSQQSQVPGCFVLTCQGAAAAASRGCPSLYEHPAGSCSSAGCSPRASETASDSTAPGLTHPSRQILERAGQEGLFLQGDTAHGNQG